MVVVTLLFYDIFKPVNSGLSLLAAFFSLVGLTFEALRLQPRGVNVAIVFAGFYCLLIGYLIFRSTFLPRILGGLMAFAGLGWLTYLSNPLVNYLSPYNLACAPRGTIGVPVAPGDGRERPKWREKTGAWRINGAYAAIGSATPDGRPSAEGRPTTSSDYASNCVLLNTRQQLPRPGSGCFRSWTDNGLSGSYARTTLNDAGQKSGCSSPDHFTGSQPSGSMSNASVSR